MQSGRLVGAVAVSMLACTVGLVAQTSTTERKEKTTIELKGGKNVTLAGCLERSTGPTDYILTDDNGRVRYAVVTDDDLAKYVDRRVEIKGRAADRGDAKVKIERKVEGTSGEKIESKAERSGDSTVLPYLGLRSIRTVGSTCR